MHVATRLRSGKMVEKDFQLKTEWETREPQLTGHGTTGRDKYMSSLF